jgi:hypothetical protein
MFRGITDVVAINLTSRKATQDGARKTCSGAETNAIEDNRELSSEGKRSLF